MKRIILIACLTLLYSNAAFGGVPFGASPFLAKFDFEKDTVNLSITDQATDGCMPAPQRVKDAYEGELRRMNIKIAKPDSASFYYMNINVMAMKIGTTGSCAYMLEVDLSVHALAKKTGSEDDLQHITPNIWEYGFMGFRSKASMQQYLEDSARGIVNDLFLELSRAKD